MKTLHFAITVITAIMLFSCSKIGTGTSTSSYTTDGITTGALSPGGSGSGSYNSDSATKAGVITAAEWNDLNNWSFWDSLVAIHDNQTVLTNWSFNTQNRVSVNVLNTALIPVNNVIVKLKRNGIVLSSATTDNKGMVELWIDLFLPNSNPDTTGLQLDINNGSQIINQVYTFKKGVNKVVLPGYGLPDNKIEVSFVVDATGSMGDELEYLKNELNNVINTAKLDNPTSTIATSCVFYRDEGDDYLTKVSDFTNDINTTISFIKDQHADGGGDFPEAVHAALDKSVNSLQWSANSKTRIIFLVLDAPPHNNATVINSLQQTLLKANEKGIKIIPITASGINKETEFIMRFFAMATNGTYVFITNDSGIGNSHLQATVGPYTVEYLNNLMVRLINKYAQ